MRTDDFYTTFYKAKQNHGTNQAVFRNIALTKDFYSLNNYWLEN